MRNKKIENLLKYLFFDKSFVLIKKMNKNQFLLINFIKLNIKIDPKMNNDQNQSNSSSQQNENIDLQDSPDMNADQQALFLNIRKSRSNDSFMGTLLGVNNQIQKRPLVLNMDEFTFNRTPSLNPSINHHNICQVVPTPNFSIFKKIKKQKKHNKCDYQKNICGYITKKIIRQFIGTTFQDFVDQLCKKYYCNEEEARKYYLSKIEYITGPSHIPVLLKIQQHDQPDIMGAKLAFRQFFQWFLIQRYLRYLILEGKMTDKKAYIQYKNNILFNFLDDDRDQIDKIAKKFITQRNQQQKMQQQLLRIRSYSSKSSKSKGSTKDKNIILTKNK